MPPVKPNLRILEINLIGLVYTAKLAMHYFRRQPVDAARDRCLIIKGSIAAYADQPGSPQYNISKWGGRGFMHNLRRTAWTENIRVNFVAPWSVTKSGTRIGTHKCESHCSLHCQVHENAHPF